VWGNITGTLSNQTDLQTALNAKFNVPAGTISQYIRGDGTLATFPTLPGGLPTGGTAGQILAKINGTDYNTEWIDNFATQTKNEVKLGQTLAKGAAVYVSSADGTNIVVSAASNASEALSSKTFGLLETGGSTNAFVKCVTFGLLAGLNTSSAQAGDPVWLGVNGALLFGVANKPVAPANMVYIGVVTRVQSNNGEIFVNIQNGFEIEELHDVLIQSKVNNQGLFYESSTGLWKNKSIATVLGYTPQAQLDGTGFVKASGTTISYDNSTYLTTSDAASTYQRLDRMAINLLASDIQYPNNNAVIAALALKANAANPVFTGNMTISGAEPKLFFTDTDNNPDYTIFIDSGIFYIYDQTAGATRFSISSTGNISAGVGKSITADSFIKDGGTASQFLKADGTIDSNTYVASSALANYLLISTAASTYQRLDNMAINLLASDTQYPNNNAVIAALALKANAANPVFTGNMSISGAEPKLFFVDTDNNPDYTVFIDSGVFFIYDQTVGTTRFSINSSGNISTGVGKSITAGSFVRDGGTASQYLMADGSVTTLANPVTGTGTTGYLPRWTSASALGNSIIQDSGTNIIVNGTATIGNDGANGDFTIISNATPLIIRGRTPYNRAFMAFSWDISPDAGVMIGNTLKFNTNATIGTNVGTTALTLATTGAATFGNSIFANGAISTTGDVFIRTTGALVFNSATNFNTQIYHDTGALVSYTGAQPRLSVLANGNVVINNNITDAGFKLDVNGTGRFNGNLTLGSGLSERLISAGSYLELYNISSGDLTLFNSFPTGAIRFCTANSLTPKLIIASNGDATFSSSIAATNANFSGNLTIDTNTLFVNSTTNRVGIRNANPGDTFVVNANTNEWGGVFVAPNTTNQSFGVQILAGTNVNDTAFRVLNGAQTVEYFKILGNGVSSFSNTITAASGEFINGGQDGSLGSVVRISTTNTNGGARNWAIVNTWDTFGDLTFRVSNTQGGNAVSAGTSVMALFRDGNVGINTTVNAGFKLDVNGTGRFNSTLQANGVFRQFIISGYFADFAYNGTNYNLGSNEATDNIDFKILGGGTFTSGGNFRWFTQTGGGTAVERMRITPGGDILFSGSATGASISCFRNNSSSLTFFAGDSGSSTKEFQWHVTNGSSQFMAMQLRTTGHLYLPKARLVGDSDIAYMDLYNPNIGNIRIVNTSSSSSFGKIELFTNNTVRFTVATDGNAVFTQSVTATSFFESSDFRLKTLIEHNPIVDGIENLQAKLYEKNGKIELGYFAQDAEKLMPYAVTNGTDGFLTLSYREVHTAKIARLEKEVAELKAQLNLN
jgi:hypothetical protein